MVEGKITENTVFNTTDFIVDFFEEMINISGREQMLDRRLLLLR